MKPSVIWAHDFENGKPLKCSGNDVVPGPERGQLRWIHLNLADQRTRDWIQTISPLPEGVRDLLLDAERHQRALVEDGCVGLVLHDIERDFDRLDAERVGALRVAVGHDIIVTARHHPLRSGDLLRLKIERMGAEVRDAADAVGLIVGAIVETIGAVTGEQARELEAFEDDLLDEKIHPDQRRLVRIRRRAVQFHRMIVGMQAVFARLERDEELPEALLPAVEDVTQQLGGLDRDIDAIQGQLRMLRDEADLQATQRTNQNIYVLSILTALFLPATLVTGFFGMNTGGLPFAQHWMGTGMATVVAVASSLAVYGLLRMLGLTRR